MSNRFRRPNIPYLSEARPNNTRYETLTDNRQPPTAEMLDGETNYVIDGMNALDDSIIAAVAGNIPGSSAIENLNKILKTNGAGVLSWVLAGEEQLANQGVTTVKIRDRAVTTEKIDNLQITTDKLRDASVSLRKLRAEIGQSSSFIWFDTTGAARTVSSQQGYGVLKASREGVAPVFERIQNANIQDAAITEPKLASNSVTTVKVLDNNITTPKVVNGAITNPKLAANAVATANILDNNVTTAKIAAANVNIAKLGADVINRFVALEGKIDQLNRANRIISGYTESANNLTFSITTGATGSALIRFYGVRISTNPQNLDTTSLTLKKNDVVLRTMSRLYTITNVPYLEYAVTGYSANTTISGYNVASTATGGRDTYGYVGYSVTPF